MKAVEKENLFLQLFKDHKDRIYRLCFGYLNSKHEVDDLFQEIMINIWNNLENFRQEASISAWIFRISVNSALLFNKRSQRKKKLFSSAQFDNMSNATEEEKKTELEDQLIQLRKCITSLKDQEKLIITLLLEDLSYQEISEVVGISANYVAVKINRIKPTLAKLMKAM